MKRDIPLPHTLLISFHYARDWNLDRWLDFRIVGDSGAYSARSQGAVISVDDLGAWAAKWRHRLYWVAALDVAGDQPQTRRNWERMNRDYGLQSVPSIHMGDDPRMMDYYVERGCDFIGLGGLAGGQATMRGQMRWLVSVFRYQQRYHPHVRLHGWGLTTRDSMMLPFWSVDSSSWGAGFRYGVIPLRDPRDGKRMDFRADGHTAFTEPYASMLTDHYGISPARIATADATTRKDIVRVSALAQMCYEKRMRRLHRPGITAPSWGIMQDLGKSNTGPNVVLADSATSNLDALQQMMGGSP